MEPTWTPSTPLSRKTQPPLRTLHEAAPFFRHVNKVEVGKHLPNDVDSILDLHRVDTGSVQSSQDCGIWSQTVSDTVHRTLPDILERQDKTPTKDSH